MLELLLYGGIEIVAFVASLVPRLGETKKVRQRRIAIGKQRRWLRHWARTERSRRAIPEMGFVCEYCEYPLAGLTKPLCPECGRRIVA